jgi:uncharacterized membrane protein
MASRTQFETTSDNQDLGLERIVFFSDAVMAIAITLLTVDLKVPEIAASAAAAELPGKLGELGPRFMSFTISFAVISVYWVSHHRYFRFIKRYDGRLITLNMIFLFFIALMPFVANLLGQYAYLPLGVGVYAAAVASTGLSIGVLWWYAVYRHRLVDKSLDAGFIRQRSIVALVAPLFFLVSIPLAWLNTTLAMACWWASPLVLFAVFRVLSRRRPRQTAQRTRNDRDSDSKKEHR